MWFCASEKISSLVQHAEGLLARGNSPATGDYGWPLGRSRFNRSDLGLGDLGTGIAVHHTDDFLQQITHASHRGSLGIAIKGSLQSLPRGETRARGLPHLVQLRDTAACGVLHCIKR